MPARQMALKNLDLSYDGDSAVARRNWQNSRADPRQSAQQYERAVDRYGGVPSSNRAARANPKDSEGWASAARKAIGQYRGGNLVPPHNNDKGRTVSRKVGHRLACCSSQWSSAVNACSSRRTTSITPTSWARRWGLEDGREKIPAAEYYQQTLRMASPCGPARKSPATKNAEASSSVFPPVSIDEPACKRSPGTAGRSN